MNLLRPSKITEKLTRLQLTLVVGFVVIALAYFAVVKVGVDASDRTARLTDFQLTMEDVKGNMLQSRRHEKDFLLRHDLEYLERHATEMQLMLTNLDRASGLAPTDQARAMVDEIRIDASEYETAFKRAAATKVELGLDENTGLHGSMRDAVHAVETLVNELDDAVMRSSMLMMRRHEKDFIQREADKYIRRMAVEQQSFATLLEETELSEGVLEELTGLMASYHEAFGQFATGTYQVNADIEIFRESVHRTEPLLESAVVLAAELAAKNKAETDTLSGLISAAFVVVTLLVAVVTIVSLLRLSRSMSSSLARLTGTVERVAEGDYAARTEMDGKDELADLGQAFDGMLSDRVTMLAETERENETLNNSVIELMDAVAQLSTRDLTITAPVAEDVTGPVADAVNMMAAETARVLREIQTIAADVSQAAEAVRDQGRKVSEVAHNESRIVQDTRRKLEEAARTMSEIASMASACDEIGARARDYTTKALETVAMTASGMSSVRETISESEKRIKRLGERSQEISAVVEIINNIAERTQVLALNASMQAAAAGEAGRGFAVVADEVQRLAESSRQSTSEIAALVRNIQTETGNAMATMNKTIEQVVEGAKLADRAGREMDATQKTAGELVDGVKQIAERSSLQATVSGELEQQAGLLQEGNQQTDRELTEQAKHTVDLAEYAQRLVASVSVFKLPA